MLSIEEYQALSAEEKAAVDRVLAKRLFTRFIVMMLLKWVLIIGITRAVRKALEPKIDET